MTRVIVTAPPAHASSPLTIPTYVEGNDEVVHPDVVDTVTGWNGYRYWMAMTPYPNTDNAYENPSLVASHDGDNWVAPAGVPAPLDGQPAGGYNSDTDLVISDGTAYLFWRGYHGTTPHERIKVITSTDAISWSQPVELLTSDQAVRRLASPSVWFDGTSWHLWAVDIVPSPNVVMYASAGDPLGPWSIPAAVTGPTVTGRDVWHIDVLERGGVLHMLINDATLDTSGSEGRLLIARSTDVGQTWTLRHDWPVIVGAAGQWDANIYRSSGVWLPDGSVDLWYSARGTTWQIGRTVLPNGLFR